MGKKVLVKEKKRQSGPVYFGRREQQSLCHVDRLSGELGNFTWTVTEVWEGLKLKSSVCLPSWASESGAYYFF